MVFQGSPKKATTIPFRPYGARVNRKLTACPLGFGAESSPSVTHMGFGDHDLSNKYRCAGEAQGNGDFSFSFATRMSFSRAWERPLHLWCLASCIPHSAFGWAAYSIFLRPPFKKMSPPPKKKKKKNKKKETNKQHKARPPPPFLPFSPIAKALVLGFWEACEDVPLNIL